MKALFTATVKSHIGQFHMPFIKELQARGYEVHAAYKDNSNQKQGLDTSAIDKIYEVPFSRSPYSPSNIKAYFALKKIIDENSYDVIHCNTPMGAVITRLAALGARKRGTKVVYTAHGFHFYKGAPRINKILFYPVEKILSRCTDALITINSEDYNAALDHNFKAKKIYHINGVGVDLSRFHSVSPDKKLALREQYGYSDDDFIMIYPADFCERKNQKYYCWVYEDEKYCILEEIYNSMKSGQFNEQNRYRNFNNYVNEKLSDIEYPEQFSHDGISSYEDGIVVCSSVSWRDKLH